MDLSKAKEKYRHHKAQAKQRGIPFLLTFEEWCDIWQKSGKWDQRGCKKGQFCMTRIGDVGPYSFNNVVIKTTADNLREAHLGKTFVHKPHSRREPMSTEQRKKLSIARLNYLKNKKEMAS